MGESINVEFDGFNVELSCICVLIDDRADCGELSERLLYEKCGECGVLDGGGK